MGHESDDLDRYLGWRVEKWQSDRKRFLQTAGAAVLAGASAGMFGAGKAFASRFGSAANPAQGVTLDVFRANHVPFYEWVGKSFEAKNNAHLNWTREQFGLIPAKLTPAFQSGGQGCVITRSTSRSRSRPRRSSIRDGSPCASGRARR